MAGIFGTMENGLEKINFSEIGISSKGCLYVANCLKYNKLMSTTLTVLNLSGNALKADGIQVC